MNSVKLVLPGYVPLSLNRIRGAHWSVLQKEKMRATQALMLAIELHSPCSELAHWTGTIISSKPCKTHWYPLTSYQTTRGRLLAEAWDAKNAAEPFLTYYQKQIK